MRKYIFLAVLTSMVIGLIACKSKTNETGIPTGTETSQPQSSKTQSAEYQKLSIIIPDDIIAKDFVITETEVLLLTDSGLISINYDGEMDNVILLSGNESYTCFSIDEDGNFNILAMNKTEDGTTNLTINHFKSDGAKLPRTVLKGTFAEEEDNPYAINYLIANGYHYVQSVFGVYIYDTAGELVFTIREETDTFTNSLFISEDEKVTSVSTRNWDNTPILIVRVFEPDASNFEEYIISITDNSPGTQLTEGGGLGLLIIEYPGLYEYSLETGRGNQLLNLIEHGVNTNEIIGLSLSSDRDIICILPRGSVFMRIAGEIAVFSTKPSHVRGTMEAYWSGGAPPLVVDTGPPKEKETITLAVVYFGDYLKNRINRFNRTNPDYKIEVINYMDGRDEKDAVRQFTIDLAHDPADIIVLTSRNEPKTWLHHTSVPIQSYARKGLFTDLYEMMDGDTTFNRADYLPNVLKALEMDGRLYSIFPTFELRVIMGKASDLGAGAIGWTLNEFISFLDIKPGAEFILGAMTKEDFISTMIEYYFTDPGTGGMKFDREAFLKILTAAERFPVTERHIVDEDDWHAFRFGLKDGNPLMFPTYLQGGTFGFRYGKIYEHLYFGEEIIYKGFPSSAGSGTYFHPDLRLAIAEKSERKDGAWEFIKFTMNDYGYSPFSPYELPIQISQLNDWLDATLVNLVGADGITEYEFNWWVGNDETGRWIHIGNNTPELNKKIMEVINATTVIIPSDQVVRDIITEEVAFYLAGQKTPGQVADIIENRVGIYLKELD